MSDFAAYAYIFLAGYALFLLGFAAFMHFENRKFGDNQFTVKLLPPPPRVGPGAPEAGAGSLAVHAAGSGDWTAVPDRGVRPVPDRRFHPAQEGGTLHPLPTAQAPVEAASGSRQAGFR